MLMDSTITFYLDKQLHDIVMSDKERFHFKGNKSILFRTIILNHYPSYSNEKSFLKDIVKNEIIGIDNSVNFSDIDYANIAWQIAKKIDSTSIFQKAKQKNKEKVNIRNGSFNQDISFILNSVPSDVTQTEYLGDIIKSYCSKPQYEREQIIFKEAFQDINLALENSQQITIKYVSNSDPEPRMRTIHPKLLTTSSEKLFNYLLYKVDDGKQAPYASSIHLYNVIRVNAEAKSCYFEDEIEKTFERMLINGPQFSIRDNTIYKIHLSSKGINLFKQSYLERPHPMDISKPEEGIFYFDCSKLQFENYFGPFYKEMTVLEPIEYAKEYTENLESVFLKQKDILTHK